MKNMMKLFVLTLALILAFTCTACADPQVTESTPTESQVMEAAPTESQVTESAPIESQVTEPAPTEPQATEPAPTQPQVTEPAPTEPEATEPTPTEPEVTEPAPTEPAPSVTNEFVNLSNYAYDVNSLSIKPRHVYWQDGKLVAECFVINGYAHTVYNIEVKSLSFANPDGLIAAGSFGSLQNLVLGPYQYAVWTFTFSPDCISAAGASLSTLVCNASTSNWY